MPLPARPLPYVAVLIAFLALGAVVARRWSAEPADPGPSERVRKLTALQPAVLRNTRAAARTDAPDPKAGIDLLDFVDVEQDKLDGRWGFDGKSLVTPPTAWGRLQLPCIPPDEYDLTLKATRIAGENSFNVGLVTAGKQCLLVLNGRDGKTNGLEIIDQKNFTTNETTFYREALPLGKPVRIKASVRRGGILITLDDKPVIDWRGDPTRLSLYDQWQVTHSMVLFLGSMETLVRIDEVVLTAVTGSPKLQR